MDHIQDAAAERSSPVAQFFLGGRGFVAIVATQRHATKVALAVLALAGSIAVYFPTLRYGFDYDDYHWIRPFSLSEVLDSTHGTWDRTHIEVPFYRPLTVLLYALRFQLFGYNAVAYHWASLVMFALAAGLFGALLLRLFHGRTLAFAGTVLFVVYPGMADTLAAWTIQQYQLLQLLLALCALHCWVGGRTRSPWRWWIPVLALQIHCFLIKEDGIMLSAALLLIHLAEQWVRGRPIGRTLRAMRGCIVSAIAVALGLIVVRTVALHGTLGGYGTPTLQRIRENELRGLQFVILGQFGTGWPGLCNSILVITITFLGATYALARRDRIARLLLLIGVAIVVTFNVPFALSTKPQQYHMLALGGVLIITGALAGLAGAVTATRGTRVWAVGIAALAGIIYVGLLTMRPPVQPAYTPDNLDPRAFNAPQTDAGNRYVWTRERAPFVFNVQPREAVTLAMEVRSAAVAGGPNAPIRVFANGQAIGEIQPEPTMSDFQTFRIAFIPPIWSLNQLRIELVTPTFTPAKDRRVLGTMVRRVSLDETAAWAQFQRRLWLFVALPALLVGAAVLARAGDRRKSRGLFAGAALSGVGALASCASLLASLFQIGDLDPNAFWAWSGGLLFYCSIAMVMLAYLGLAARDLGSRADERTARPSEGSTYRGRLMRRLPMLVFVVCVAALVFNMDVLTQRRAAVFHPYSEVTLANDDVVLRWPYELPPALRAAIMRKSSHTDGAFAALAPKDMQP